MFKWRRVFRVVPVPIFYTNKLPAGVGARVAWYAPVVQIRPKYRGDESLHQHELEHVRQWWLCFAAMSVVTTLGVVVASSVLGHPMPQQSLIVGIWLSWLGHTVLHRLSRSYRAITEINAYRRQIRYADSRGEPMSIEAAAARLSSSRYMLGFSREEARQLLGQAGVAPK